MGHAPDWMRQNYAKKSPVHLADGGEPGLGEKFVNWVAGDDTRSVMEKPAVNNMTDPQYRQEMEQKQALQEPPISPEDLALPVASKLYRVSKAFSLGEKLATRPKPDVSKIADKWVDQEQAAVIAKRKQDYYNKKYDEQYAPFSKGRKKYERGEAESDHFNPKGPYKISTDTLADRVEKEGMKAYRSRVIDQMESNMNKEALNESRRRGIGHRVAQSLKSSIVPSAAGSAGNLAMELEDQVQGKLDSLKGK